MELLRRIPAKYIRATLSNSNTLHWPRMLDEMRLGEAFDHHFASHLIGKIKPDPAVFDHMIETLDCQASEILFLDDNRLNVEGAQRPKDSKIGRTVHEADKQVWERNQDRRCRSRRERRTGTPLSPKAA